jgi:predicted DNA binding CopG/RHH family protein
MSSPKTQFKLDELEKDIEEHAEEFITVSPKIREKIEKIIRKAKKTKNVNLRLSDQILEEIKTRASLDGIPYQTYINSILHKYVTGQLVDRDRVIELLTIKKALDEKDLS